MASRFTENKPIIRCYSPVKVFRNGEFNYFPCGRCPACLLDKQNSLSLRLANEIETFPFSIFFTLTYSNKYIPRLYYHPYEDGVLPYYYSNHPDNIRFDGVKDKKRDDDIFIEWSSLNIAPITNFGISDCISYLSKRDIQLWLKSMRKDIDITFNLENKNESDKRNYHFRYFIIGEYGPTSLRCHYHGILFAYSPEVAEYLIRVSMYSNWQMCDKALFDKYTHFADSGAAGYVSQYLTCPDSLPKILKDKQIRPFRLSSKSPAIGFSSFDKKEIFENLFRGVNEYTKAVCRIDAKYVFPYPSEFMHRLLPKCREYSLVSHKRLSYIYGFLWRNVYKRRFSFDTVSRFIRSRWFPADVTAAQKAWQAWNTAEDYRIAPATFLYLIDMYYYKEGMFALKKFYEWQQNYAKEQPITCMFSYQNFSYRVTHFDVSSEMEKYTLSLFLSSFGLTLYDVIEQPIESLAFEDDTKSAFKKEVEDILRNALKMPKFNEQFGFAPHIV